jgi:membrane-associated protease RseP (regulator of RpoE activity)
MRFTMKTWSFALAIFAPLALLPVASAQPILNKVEKLLRDQLDAANKTATAEPGYLGLTGDDAAEAGRGVRVIEVVPGHAAAQAGLEKGDLITQIDQQPIRTIDDMSRALEGKPSGAKLAISVVRAGAARQFDVLLGRRENAPGEAPQPPANASPFAPSPAQRLRLGVRTLPVTEPVRRLNNLPAARGAHVISVVVGSPAEKAGIPLGAVVTAVNNTPVNTPEELAAAIAGTPAGEVELAYVHRARRARAKVSLAPGEGPSPQVRARPPIELPGPAGAAPSDVIPPTASPPKVAPPAAAAPKEPPPEPAPEPAAAEPAPAAPPKAALPETEKPSLPAEDPIQALVARLEQLEARIKSLEAELAKLKTPAPAKPE